MIDYDKLVSDHISLLARVIELEYAVVNLEIATGNETLATAPKEELAKPEPKYKDAWYVGAGGHARCTKVLNQEGYAFCDETDIQAVGLHVTCYPTKAALIESQVKYWGEMLCKENGGTFDGVKCLRDEYCNVSGVKLGRPEITDDGIDTNLSTDWCTPKGLGGVKLGKREPEGTTGCQHESDGRIFSFSAPTGVSFDLSDMKPFKCIKCGELYR
jgi:hypothetical protein